MLKHVQLMRNMCCDIQWNPSKLGTVGSKDFVLNSEVSFHSDSCVLAVYRLNKMGRKFFEGLLSQI